MAALITISIIVGLTVCAACWYLAICLAIGRDDRTKWSLRVRATNKAARSARTLVGLNSSKWG